MKFLIALSLILFSFIEGKTLFPLIDEPIDVVIPSTEKDLVTLELCLAGIKENGKGIRRIIVVSKTKLTDKAEWFDEASYPFSYQEITEALAKGDLEGKKVLELSGRTGWYLQQLLKLYAPLVIPGISSNVLILDSDTIFLNPVTFLNEHFAGMYNPGCEYHPAYFNHASRLHPEIYKLFGWYSGISHHMIFQKPVVQELLERVETLHSAPFWKVFCQLVEPENYAFSGASEYEIYFNYLFSRTDQPSIRLLKWKNINKLSEIPLLKEEGFHYVSAHSYHRIQE